MARKQKAIQGQFANASAVLLAASSTNTRYIRSFHITNEAAAQRVWNLGYGATMTATTPGVFGEVIQPNTAGPPSRVDRHYGGHGKRIDNLAISGFADVAANVAYEIIYDESDTVDAT